MVLAEVTLESVVVSSHHGRVSEFSVSVLVLPVGGVVDEGGTTELSDVDVTLGLGGAVELVSSHHGRVSEFSVSVLPGEGVGVDVGVTLGLGGTVVVDSSHHGRVSESVGP